MRFFVAAYGNAEEIGCWSGVPYLFISALRCQGHQCVCGDMNYIPGHRWVRIFFNRVVRRLFMRKSRVAFAYTRLSTWWVGQWAKRQIRRVGDVDGFICFDFSCDCSSLGVPSVLIHDWPSAYWLDGAGRPMTASERRGLSRQLEAMRSATQAVTLYPKVYEYLIGRHALTNARFYGNPTNVDNPFTDVDAVLSTRCQSNRILCIGCDYYRSSVDTVIKAVAQSGRSDWCVDVIGLKAVDNPHGVNVRCYGYLNRADSEQAAEYWRLVAGARCLVNVRKGWGGGTSVAEVMYGYLPVIVGDYPDIMSLYDNPPSFGYYVSQEDVLALRRALEDIFSLPERKYRAMCVAAHDVTAPYTYDYIVKRLIADLYQG